MSKIFTFHSDPGHGWLEVSQKDLDDVSLNYTDFSGYSFVNAFAMFLEEDSDAPKFIDAYKVKHGESPAIKESFKENTPIRRMEYNPV